MIEPIERKLVLYSHLAFYPIHWQAFLHLCAHYRVRGTAIAVAQADLPLVHQQLGWVDPPSYRARPHAPAVRILPARNRLARVYQLCKELWRISPDAIWAQEEPTDPYLLQILGMYLFNRRPRIVSAVCEHSLRRGRQLCAFSDVYYGLAWMAYWQWPFLLWGGFVLPVCQRGFRQHLWWLAPPPLLIRWILCRFRLGARREISCSASSAASAKRKDGRFFSRRCSPCPGTVYCLLAGDGPQLAELQEWMKRPELRERVSYMGLLPRTCSGASTRPWIAW